MHGEPESADKPVFSNSTPSHKLCSHSTNANFDHLIIIIVHEFHGDTSLKQNFRATVLG